MYLLPIIIAVSFAALSLSYPVALLLYFPSSINPKRWIQNNPSISVFLLSSFPIALYIFSLSLMKDVKVSEGLLDEWFLDVWFSNWHVWVSYSAIVITVLIITPIVIDDFTRRPIAPYILKKHAALEAARLEKELRDDFQAHRHRGNLAAKQKEYQNLVQLGSLKAIWTRGGPIAYIHLVLTWLGALITLAYFWYLVAATLYRTTEGTGLDATSKNRLVLVYILLLTWFPLRLHTEWYQNYFHKKDWLKTYPAFWLLAFLAFAILILVILIVSNGPVIKLLSIGSGVFGAILGLIGKLKPDWLRYIANFLQATSFVYFLAIYLIFLVLVAAVTAAVWFSSNT
jgi:hypothetical protein